ncbi:hypothetical protein B9Z19DRAFT_1068396 [Tuber borchii]|uniref:Uncharacterized protein n=1 Tax=Tuber borchii TaxID=42251 RepID=A0A2T6ZFC1_TUBBO|nr:hypothetical protein B9Z19DRAFT_1068396 [Tuber borchii]
MFLSLNLKRKSTKLSRRARPKPETIFAMFRKLNYYHRKELLGNREQSSLIPQGRVKYYVKRYKNQKEATKKDRTVAHFRQALEINTHNFRASGKSRGDEQLRDVRIQLQDKLKKMKGRTVSYRAKGTRSEIYESHKGPKPIGKAPTGRT